MADKFSHSNSDLLCAENSNTCFDVSDISSANELNQESRFDHSGSKVLTVFLLPLNQEMVRAMIEKEAEFLPKDDYLKRLRSGDLDLSLRRAAIDWITKAHAYHSFGELSLVLAINYLDRVLSVYPLAWGKRWIMQLLSVTCLSLAAKVEETEVPQSVDLQVGEPVFVFEAKTIQRMELLVLNILNWRMQAITPCSFIGFFLVSRNLPSLSISKSMQLILTMIKGIDFLEFRPSEIAAAVAIAITGGVRQALDEDWQVPCFVPVEKERVMRCVEVIRACGEDGNGGNGSALYNLSVPRSPVGVLDVSCLSCKSDELTVGSCANSHLEEETREAL